MDDRCLMMKDYIIEYVQGSLRDEEKLMLISHLKYCLQCREELAITVKLSRLIISQEKKVPKDIKDTAFSLVKVDNKNNTLSNIRTSLEPLDQVYQALITTKKSIKLAFQFI
ncbi:MAG: hypothetical protein GX185_08695 [Tissierellia bacterium]|nr:hypothetical protein [Tissierellia bacterium]